MNLDITEYSSLMNWAFNLYAGITTWAAPVALAFGIGNLIVSTFLRVAFGGKLKFGGK